MLRSWLSPPVRLSCCSRALTSPNNCDNIYFLKSVKRNIKWEKIKNKTTFFCEGINEFTRSGIAGIEGINSGY